jgi:KUP system potassium uptake protein
MSKIQVSEGGFNRYTLVSTLAALGVVYGDIGTSPLYTIRECFHGSHAVPVTRENVLGVLSLIFWSLTLVVTVKYLMVVMRADNRGEGGVLALLALAHPRRRAMNPRQQILVSIGLFGAALLYGDGMLTPAISVLSAVEGFKVITNVFEPFIVPLTLLILVVLFMVQPRGTQKIGIFFGPFILFWFGLIGALGLLSILKDPSVLAALNPLYAVNYFLTNGWIGFPVLGAVFLCLTGAEALYADMGHFGRKTIQFGWLYVAFPGLILNYFGQGALLLRNPEAIEKSPFYLLAPPWMLLPLVLLATLATCVASQAVISGAFSITRQAVQLGYLPRLEVRHTSSDEIGQIYVPLVNWGLLIATVFLVVMFRTSSNLAAAYGIAVSMTMVITAILTFFVARQVWRMNIYLAVTMIGFFLVIDIAFLSANLLKLFHGGYVPLIIGGLIFVLMATWKKGRYLLGERLKSALMPPERFLKEVAPTFPNRLPGTAIFMARSTNLIPPALFHNVKHNQVLHDTVVLLSVRTEEIPHVPIPARVEVENLGMGFFSVMVHYGFMDTPNIPEAMRLCAEQGLKLNPITTTYFLSRETLIANPIPGMAIWREHLFSFMTRNAYRAATFFKIPAHQVVELGIEIEI